MTEVSNLSQLRNLPITTELVYVKAHTFAEDKGGGFFEWRTTTPFKTGGYSNENYGTIIKSNIVASNQGSWIRQYDGFINVVFFGALGLGNDYNADIQRAIDFASLNAGDLPAMSSSTVFIPNGVYGVSGLVLKDGVSILGESLSKTHINANNGGVSGEYLFEIDKGPIHINVSNLKIFGRDTIRGCFHFDSDYISTSSVHHGGLWNSNFSNISITKFKGHGIYFEGGAKDSDFLLPNQQSLFENIIIERASFNGNALKMSGQNGLISFIECTFDGYKTNENTYATGHNVNIKNNNIFISAGISFINCASQSSDYGFVIEWAENIFISNCWFEKLGVAITIKSSIGNPNSPELHPSRAITIINNRFANAAGFGSVEAPSNIKNGQCISVDNSYVSITDNYITIDSSPESQVFFNVNSSFVYASDNVNSGVVLNNNNFQLPKLARSYGIVKGVSIVTNTINCFGNRSVFVQFSNETINTIESQLNAGEYMTIRANGGSIKFSRIDNIFFSTFAPLTKLTLENGEIATFLKIDKAYNGNSSFYQLTSVLKAF